MSWASRRQALFIGMGLLLFVVVASAAVFYFYPKPSCTDGKQNQNEQGVDCGGACQKICLNTVIPLAVEWTRPFVVTPGVSSVVAYVANPNVKLGAENVPYIFRLYDDKNLLIAERRGKALIIPNASFPIFEGGIGTGSRSPARAHFEFTGVPSWRTLRGASLLIQDKVLSEPLTAPRFSAVLGNSTSKLINNIEVVAVLFDGSGNAMAASETFVERLGKGEKREVIFTWREPFKQVPSRIEIYPKALAPL